MAENQLARGGFGSIRKINFLLQPKEDQYGHLFIPKCAAYLAKPSEMEVSGGHHREVDRFSKECFFSPAPYS